MVKSVADRVAIHSPCWNCWLPVLFWSVVVVFVIRADGHDAVRIFVMSCVEPIVFLVLFIIRLIAEIILFNAITLYTVRQAQRIGGLNSTSSITSSSSEISTSARRCCTLIVSSGVEADAIELVVARGRTASFNFGIVS